MNCWFLFTQAPEDEDEGNEEDDIAAFVARSKRSTAQAKATKAMAKAAATGAKGAKAKAPPKNKK